MGGKKQKWVLGVPRSPLAPPVGWAERAKGVPGSLGPLSLPPLAGRKERKRSRGQRRRAANPYLGLTHQRMAARNLKRPQSRTRPRTLNLPRARSSGHLPLAGRETAHLRLHYGPRVLPRGVHLRTPSWLGQGRRDGRHRRVSPQTTQWMLNVTDTQRGVVSGLSRDCNLRSKIR